MQTQSMCVTFFSDQYINSLYHLNINLWDVFWNADQGDILPYFSCQRKDCLQRIPKLLLQWQKAGRFWGNNKFLPEKKGENLRTTSFLNTFSQYTNTEIKQQHDIMKY